MVVLDIGTSVQRLSDEFFVWLPRLGAAIVILVVAWFVARLLGKAVRKVLDRLDLNAKAKARQTRPEAGRLLERISMSGVVAGVVYWLILLVGFSLALNALQIPRLDDAVATVWGYVPNLLGAALIMVVALILAGAVGGGVAKLMGDTALGKIVASVAPILILTIASFMALVHLQLAVQIVTLTYAIVLGGIALGAALAFGIGGRGAAQRMLDGAYEKGQERMPQARSEMATAKERASERADQAAEGARRRFRDGSGDTQRVPVGHDSPY